MVRAPAVASGVHDINHIAPLDEVVGEAFAVIRRVKPGCTRTAPAVEEDDRCSAQRQDGADLFDIELVGRELAGASLQSPTADVEEVAGVRNSVRGVATRMNGVDPGTVPAAELKGRGRADEETGAKNVELDIDHFDGRRRRTAEREDSHANSIPDIRGMH